ncbi:7738_t:CDS:1, partial [Racocetra fulgida]
QNDNIVVLDLLVNDLSKENISIDSKNKNFNEINSEEIDDKTDSEETY